MNEPECCAHCGELDHDGAGAIKFVAIGTPGSLVVHKAWLHEQCEHPYLETRA
jgi:hypothetical protein